MIKQLLLNKEIGNRMTVDIITNLVQGNFDTIDSLAKKGNRVIIFEFPDSEELLKGMENNNIPGGYKIMTTDAIDLLRETLGRHCETYQLIHKHPHEYCFDYIQEVNVFTV